MAFQGLIRSAFAVFFLVVLACSTPAPDGIDVVVDLTIINPVQPIVSGRTNLPDGTVLSVTLQGNLRQAQAVVSGGQFQSEPFSDYGSFLKPGMYRAIVIMPAASTQPPSVQEIIGKDGGKLRGSFVKRSPTGAVVETQLDFRVEGVTL